MKKSLHKLRKFFYHHPVYNFLFVWVGWVIIQIAADSLREGELYLDRFISTTVSGIFIALMLTYFNRLVMQQSDQKELYED